VSKARDLLGWQAQVPLEVGLARTVAWLRAQRTADTVAP
jgi:nucleoside-diphosphate-sugar epimerase